MPCGCYNVLGQCYLLVAASSSLCAAASRPQLSTMSECVTGCVCGWGLVNTPFGVSRRNKPRKLCACLWDRWVLYKASEALQHTRKRSDMSVRSLHDRASAGRAWPP